MEPHSVLEFFWLLQKQRKRGLTGLSNPKIQGDSFGHPWIQERNMSREYFLCFSISHFYFSLCLFHFQAKSFAWPQKWPPAATSSYHPGAQPAGWWTTDSPFHMAKSQRRLYPCTRGWGALPCAYPQGQRGCSQSPPDHRLRMRGGRLLQGGAE